ncbi:MAG: hypothetical protein QOE23_27 [Pseudonocardiales bacterium]|jgi:DNA-binding transcriptional MerR regulator|nr:hypothetical protein [Pseudonocardiales bacterium]
MRISELAQRSGLPVATIKFYLREGLLAPGTPISRTQAEYSDAHLERLRLIRALRDIADLPVATVGTVLAAVDDEEIPLLDLLGVTQTAVAGFKGSAAPSESGAELAQKLLADLDWTLTEDSPLVDSLARVLDVLHGEGEPVDAESLRPWADAARAVAEVEMDHIPVEAPRAEAAHIVAVGTVMYGELLAQLRLAAQEAVSLERYSREAPPAGTEVAQDHPAAGDGQVEAAEATGSKSRRAGSKRAGSKADQAGPTADPATPKPDPAAAKTHPAGTKSHPAGGKAHPAGAQNEPTESKSARVSRRVVGRRRSRG